MKRILILVVLGICVLGVLAVGALFYLGPLVKAGVEKAGPQIAKVPVLLEEAKISVLNGRGELNGFRVANPDGFKTPEAMKVGTVEVRLEPKSVFEEKVVVRSVRIEAPEITYEAGFGGSNIGKLLENIEAVVSQEKSANTNAVGKPLQVDELLITGGKINVSATLLGGRSATLPLPDIRLANLGQGPEGITAAELSSRVFGAVVEAAAKTVASNALSIGKSANEAAQSATTGAKDRLQKLGAGVSDLLKSKTK